MRITNSTTVDDTTVDETSVPPFDGTFVVPPFDGTYAQLPTQLRSVNSFVVWRREKEKDKTTGKERWNKPPYNARTGIKADKTNPADYSDFETALKKFQEPPGRAKYAYHGLGVCLTAEDYLVTFDLDECVDEHGNIAPWAVEYIKQFNSYWEGSPTDGLHCTFTIKWRPPDNTRTVHIDGHKAEFLISKSYFTVTGRHIEGTPNEVRECTEAFNKLYAQIPPAQAQKKALEKHPDVPPDLENGKLIDWAMAAKATANGTYPCSCGAKTHTYGELLTDRYKGSDIHDGNDTSAADYNLCESLAWWTRKNAAWMDDIFRKSPRMREKWDEVHYSDGRTYGEGTIDAAILGCRDERPPDSASGAQCGDGGQGQASGGKAEGEPKKEGEEDDGFTTWDDIFSRRPGKAIIAGYIYENEDTLLVAQKGVGKTFQLTSWDMRIAAGIDAEQGVVIRVVGEGGHGIPRRNSGWCNYNHIDPATIKDNFIFWERPLNLLNDACVNAFIKGLKNRIAGRRAVLTSFDTLSQCLGVSGESENDNSKLAKALGSVVRIRQEAGIEASVILHHEGHTASGRARGASAIADNVANVFQLEYGQGQEHDREPTVWLRAKNVRDEELPPPVRYRRTVVNSSVVNNKGQVLTTCVLVPMDGIHFCNTEEPEKPLTPSAKKLQKALTADGLTYNQLREKTGLAKRTFDDALNLLKDRELLTHDGSLYKKLPS